MCNWGVFMLVLFLFWMGVEKKHSLWPLNKHRNWVRCKYRFRLLLVAANMLRAFTKAGCVTLSSHTFYLIINKRKKLTKLMPFASMVTCNYRAISVIKSLFIRHLRPQTNISIKHSLLFLGCLLLYAWLVHLFYV